jgi:hypothetical protein
VEALMRAPALTTKLESLGADPLTQPAEQFADFVKKDYAKWTGVVKAADVKFE